MNLYNEPTKRSGIITAVGMLILTACVVATVQYFSEKNMLFTGDTKAEEVVSESSVISSLEQPDSENSEKESAEESAKETESEPELPIFVEITEPVYTNSSAIVRKNPNTDSEKLGVLDIGDSLMRTGFSPTGWDRVEYKGETAYVLHMFLCSEHIGGVAKKSSEDESENLILAKEASESDYPTGWLRFFNNKIAELQREYPSGKYWNHMGSDEAGIGVTDIPCNHEKYGTKYCNQYGGVTYTLFLGSKGIQCLGFASLLSDAIFGEDAPIRTFTDYDELRVGDQARINNDTHSVIIIDKTDEYVIVAECNADYDTCVISWGRKIKREKMEKGFYITRWD